MKKTLLLAITLCQSALIIAQMPAMQWTKSIGGSSGSAALAYSTVVDGAGNVYTTGYFQSTVDFDPSAATYTLTAASGQDIFVSKLDASGNFIWAKAMGGTGNEIAKSIAVDALGNVYTTGYFQGTSDFNPSASTYTLASAGGNDVFISKLNSGGNFVWAKAIGSTSNDQAISITVDGSGNIYTTGFFTGSVDFNPDLAIYNLTSIGGQDIFISKLDISGNFVLAKAMGGGMSNDAATSIKVDALGNIYTTGYFSGTADFDPNVGTYTLTSAGGTDVFISKLDALGNFVFAKPMGGNAGDAPNSMAIDGLGNIYTTGSFSSIADFNPGTGINNLNTSGTTEIFISKLDASGNYVWAKQMQGSGINSGNSIALDASGNAYITGYYNNSTDFDPDIINTYILTPANLYDLFILKLSTLGNFIWAKSIGGISNDLGHSITIDASANVYVSGYFSGTVDFDPNIGIYNLSSVGSYDAFIHKMSQCITPTNPINTTPISQLTNCAGESATLTATATGTINWYATPSSTVILGTGISFSIPVLSVGSYTYYASTTNSCGTSGTTPFNITINTCTSLNELYINSISVFPNPNNGMVNINLNADTYKNSILEIYNALGKIVFKQTLPNDLNQIDISHLQSGIYICKITNNTKTIKIEKLIKQ